MKILNKYFDSRVILFKTQRFRDKRGYFEETYNKLLSTKYGFNKSFVQDNTSFSKNINTFRGIHVQIKPYSQAKLIRVIKGSLIDYVIDLRLNSKTFGKSINIKINEADNKQIFIPEHFGHAFLTTSNNTVVSYKVSKYYSKKHSISIAHNDPKINLKISNEKKLILSKNDKNGIFLNDFKKILMKARNL